jgi:hypothetical protein
MVQAVPEVSLVKTKVTKAPPEEATMQILEIAHYENR